MGTAFTSSTRTRTRCGSGTAASTRRPERLGRACRSTIAPRTGRCSPRPAAGGGDEVAVGVAPDPPAAVLSLEAGRALLPAGKTIAVRVDTSPIAGLSGPLRLDVAGLPAGVHAEFSPPQVAAGETAMLTLTAEAAAPAASVACVLGLTGTQAAWSVDFSIDV